jgi:glycerol-3-phosphate dehydrogenase (NAD(P)+)
MIGIRRIGILGAGAWGMALANACARTGRIVELYDEDPEVMTELRDKRTNSKRLPGVALADAAAPSESFEDVAAHDALLLAVPTQHFRALCSELAPHVADGTPLVACAKGIERGTGKFVTEIIEEIMPAAPRAILSGPSFASDVARGLPAAVTVAAHEDGLAATLAETLSSPLFRIYHSTDVRGAEIGGAAKNVLAIAAGIVAGRELGASALAALITRGFAELMRFGHAYGARPETLMGLSGLGDLILTCSTPQSRNFSLGLAIGRGEKIAPDAGATVEGAFTAPILVELARTKRVDTPVAEAVQSVLGGADVGETIERLLARPIKAEL